MSEQWSNGVDSDGMCIYAATPEALLASANAALPDDSPYKITRHMVSLMRRAVVHEPYGGSGSTPDREGTDRLRSYAKAMAALLPPE